jgi:hypothetical protein
MVKEAQPVPTDASTKTNFVSEDLEGHQRPLAALISRQDKPCR